jgi:hypothetical protein
MAITPRYCFFLTADRAEVLLGFEDAALAFFKAAAFLSALFFAEAAASFLCLRILFSILFVVNLPIMSVPASLFWGGLRFANFSPCNIAL